MKKQSYKVGDAFNRLARKHGFPSRAVFKLQQIDQKHNLLHRGDRVLDLGCHPGSWCIYAAHKVGPEGRVLGIDLQKCTGLGLPSHASTVRADVPAICLPSHASTVRADVRAWAAVAPEGLSFDVVLSDLAPGTTGQRELDSGQSFHLALLALHIAQRVLSPRGTLLVKYFQSTQSLQLLELCKQSFAHVKSVKPEASRKHSRETFLLAQQWRQDGRAALARQLTPFAEAP
eukprot:g27526.t1